MKQSLVTAFLIAVFTSLASAATDFTETEITVKNDRDGLRLAGTLTLPAEGEPKASIVLATGSGSQNRDEEILGKKPFKTIADTLASHGYAVLRFDDRGVGGSGGDPSKAVNDDFVYDMGLCVAYADSLLGKPVGILGHSEGGLVAIKSAVRNPAVNFIITLAAPAFSLDSVTLYQVKTLTAAVGQPGIFEKQRPALQARYDLLKSSLPSSFLRGKLYLSALEEVGDAAALPQVKERIAAELEVMLSPWYRDLLRYDPTHDIAVVNVPWLAINGDRDSQVDVNSLARFHELNHRVDTVVMPAHNHLFQSCVTGLPDEYATLEGDISDATLRVIVDWMDNLTKSTQNHVQNHHQHEAGGKADSAEV